jgi:hypothetical protein
MIGIQFSAGYNGQLVAIEGRNTEIIFAPRFGQSSNQKLCKAYLVEIARQLNETTDPDAVEIILADAKRKISNAQSDERFCKVPTF